MDIDLIFYTGAGVSVASGLETFRGDNKGLWSRYDPAVVCNMATFHENKDKVFEFYNMRKESYGKHHPNEAHHIIQRMIAKYGGRLFTSNVDALHEAAGSTAVHVHGSMNLQQCLHCGFQWNIGLALFDQHATCPNCFTAGDSKPGVVLFGESAPKYQDLFDAMGVSDYGEAVDPRPNLLKIVMGTSLNVVSPDMLGVGVGTTVFIDPNPPEGADEVFDVVIAAKAEEAGEQIETVIEAFIKHLKDSGL